MTFEEKKERVEGFRPIDDVFFEVLADDREVCQEILRTILKEQEGGVAAMCEIMEKYMDEAKAAGIKEGKAAGIKEEKRLAICRMIKKEFDKQTILDLGYTELEYEEARESMPVSV